MGSQRVPAWLAFAFGVVFTVAAVYALFGKDLAAARALREGVQENIDADRQRSEMRQSAADYATGKKGKWVATYPNGMGATQSFPPSEEQKREAKWTYVPGSE